MRHWQLNRVYPLHPPIQKKGYLQQHQMQSSLQDYGQGKSKQPNRYQIN